MHPLIYIGAYILIGIFVAAVFIHMDDHDYGDEFDIFMLAMLFWPILIAVLVLFLIFAIPYILGKWAGHLLQDLMRCFK